MGRGRLTVSASAVSLMFLVATASASACGSTTAGPVVQHGQRPGLRWSQVACSFDGLLIVDMNLYEHGTDDGASLEGPFPSRGLPLVVAGFGDDLGSRDESEIDGITAPDAVAVRLSFGRGPEVVVPTRWAPAPERAAHRYLRRVRFFVRFFPRATAEPRRACAVDRTGRQLGCYPWRRTGPAESTI